VSELDFLLKRKEGRSEESSAQGRGSGDGERELRLTNLKSRLQSL